MSILILLAIILGLIAIMAFAASMGSSSNGDVSSNVVLRHPSLEITENVSLGFSATTFFFGSIVMFMRKDFQNAIKYLFIKVVFAIALILCYSMPMAYVETTNVLLFYVCVLSFLFHLALGAYYNRAYASSLISLGYVPSTSEDEKMLILTKVKIK
ncbi:hypothetical protein ACRHK7_06210 [Weissella tructae]|uniref:Uncharacterized protein n=1 Tax=Weissella tructae TaxID=887702 RepID=A0ABN4DGZ5_9LACO|nr:MULTISPECIES: hypothetical protein [Weissella]AIG65559.1 hypothetical protein WS08_0620 [Weissella tructae]AIM64271.1 hypothetical protein WS105_0681 [Weissella ceti]ELA06983.1 hypothetical protein WCNC_05367 [Weissella ceti NC36]QVV90691.1 hypothetical protein KHQ32_03375 [Weissella tructae]